MTADNAHNYELLQDVGETDSSGGKEEQYTIRREKRTWRINETVFSVGTHENRVKEKRKPEAD